jgi:hypothetical protein
MTLTSLPEENGLLAEGRILGMQGTVNKFVSFGVSYLRLMKSFINKDDFYVLF